MAKKLRWFDWLLSVLVAIALLDWSLVDLFNFSIISQITFGVGWLATIVYLIVSIFGLVWLVRLIVKAIK